MSREEAIENFKEFIDHFQTQIKQAQAISDKAFDVERAERDIQTFEMAISALEQQNKRTSDEEMMKFLQELIGERKNPYDLEDLEYTLERYRQDEQEPCDDAISREAVNALYDKWRPRLATHVSEFGYELKSLPLVEPSRRKGHWIKTPLLTCDSCEKINKGGIESDFCPNCGASMADMRGDTK